MEMRRRSKGEKIFSVFNAALMILLALFFLLPVWHVAMGSISDPLKVSANTGLILWPLGKATLGGYRLILQNSFIFTSYMNTLIYVAGATLFSTFITILAAYVLSRQNVKLNKIFNFLIIFTMIFNGGLIPNYILVRNLGMLDTRWALIIPFTVAPYNIMIMRTSFQQIPEELFDAAKIDGAGYAKILWDIVLPISKAILAVIILFYVIANWNAWFNASLYLTDRNLYPLQLTLREIVLLSTNNSVVADADGADVMIFRPLIKYATIMISIIPMLIIYPFIQKYFVSGVMIGSVKG